MQQIIGNIFLTWNNLFYRNVPFNSNIAVLTLLKEYFQVDERRFHFALISAPKVLKDLPLNDYFLLNFCRLKRWNLRQWIDHGIHLLWFRKSFNIKIFDKKNPGCSNSQENGRQKICKKLNKMLLRVPFSTKPKWTSHF